MSLRGTECHGNLGGVVGECFVSPHRPSAEIASSLILLATTVEVGRDCFVAGTPRNGGEVCRVLLRTGADAPAYPTLLAKTGEM